MNKLMKASMAMMLCTGICGCTAKTDSSNLMTTSEIEEEEHEFGEQVVNDDGSITVYLNGGASFKVAEGTTQDEIDAMLDIFSPKAEAAADEGDESTEDAEAEEATEAADGETVEDSAGTVESEGAIEEATEAQGE